MDVKQNVWNVQRSVLNVKNVRIVQEMSYVRTAAPVMHVQQSVTAVRDAKIVLLSVRVAEKPVPTAKQ